MAALLMALLGGLAMAACGSDSTQDSGGPTVSATTGIIADITASVAGNDATVEQVIPDSASPHEFQLSAQDRAGIEDSLLLVYNGAGLEAGIPIDEIDAPKFALADHVGPLEHFQPAGSREHPSSEPDEEGGLDPHVWMDPTRVAAAVPALADALAQADPEHAAGYRARAARYAAELAALDIEVSGALEVIPPQDRKLVTSHDALGYFASRYGFAVLATPFPATGPEAEASVQTIQAVEDAIRGSGVPTVFAQETDDPEVLRQIAEETGVEIEEGLPIEAPGDAGTYVGMLRRDAELLAEGLAPAGGQTGQ
ncbi:MAG: metal ABC transporter substrate-binding protein [Actinomycetota bacterium]|nr:metal ABC transporter substrate-binding protein [Actinomycetota bacterium]